MAVFDKVIQLNTSDWPLVLRVIGSHDCSWLADAIARTWLRIPTDARQRLVGIWSANPVYKKFDVKSPCIMAGEPESGRRSLGVSSGCTAIFLDQVRLKRVHEDPDGLQLLETAIAHEFGHLLHSGEGNSTNKPLEQVEAEVDALISSWGFTGDVRGWIDRHPSAFTTSE